MENLKCFLCLSCLTILFASVSSQDKENPMCDPAPKKIVEFKWSQGANTDKPLYFPLGYRNDTNMVKQMLYGSTLNADEDLIKLCPRLTFNSTFATISGVNGTFANFKLGKKDGDGKLWSFNTYYQGNNSDFNHKVQVVLTDGKTYGLALRCWGNGLLGWTAFSTTKFLHDDVQLRILETVKSLGFSTADSLPLRYKSCE